MRVFPENDFSPPYKMLWHRDPVGRWSIHVDGARLDTACPRCYGAASAHVAHARIYLEWTAPMALRVAAPAIRLDWTLTATETPLLRALNVMSARLPTWAWRPRSDIGGYPMPARGVLGVGQAAWPILDAEYGRTRNESTFTDGS